MLDDFLNTGKRITQAILVSATTLTLGHALTLEEATTKAIANSPSLVATEAGVEEQLHRFKQSGNWLNPSLSMEAENFAGSGAFEATDAAEYTIALEQPLELGGKRRSRRHLAEIDLNSSTLEVVLKQQQVRAEVRRRYVRSLHARDRLHQAEGLVQTARSAAEAVKVKHGMGAAAGLDDRRTKVALSLAEIEVERASQSYAESRELLVSLWEGTEDLEISGSLHLPDKLPNERVFDELLRNSHRWKYTLSPLARQKQVLAYQRSTAWPDLSIGVGHRWFEENSAEAWLVGLSVDIPIFDRNLGEIEAAASAVRRTNAEVEDNCRRLQESLKETLFALRRSHEAASRLREEALPLAQETLDLVAEGYRLGQYELLYLLEARRTLTDVEQHWINTLADFHLAVADLEELVGSIPPSLELQPL